MSSAASTEYASNDSPLDQELSRSNMKKVSLAGTVATRRGPPDATTCPRSAPYLKTVSIPSTGSVWTTACMTPTARSGIRWRAATRSGVKYFVHSDTSPRFGTRTSFTYRRPTRSNPTIAPGIAARAVKQVSSNGRTGPYSRYSVVSITMFVGLTVTEAVRSLDRNLLTPLDWVAP